MPRKEIDGLVYTCKRCNDEFYTENGRYCGICDVILREMRLYSLFGKGIKFASPDGEMVARKAAIAGGGDFVDSDFGEVVGERFFRV